MKSPESAHMLRERLALTGAAAILSVSAIRLGQWLNGTLNPTREEVVRVLGRAI